MEEVLRMDTSWNSKPWRIAAWSGAAAIMLFPIGIQLVSGNFGWSAADFLFLAVILLTGCLVFDFAARKAPNFSYLAGASAALAASFGLVVVNGAVGLVGSENEAHNLLFLVAILVATFGAIIARGRATGMARVMFLAAITHVAVSTALLIDAGGVSDGDPLMEVIGLSVFAAVWLASGLLFRNASGAH